MKRTPVGIIGVGKMGSALVSGWLSEGTLLPEDILVYDPLPAAVASLPEELKKSGTDHPSTIAKRCSTIVVAVKPKDVASCVGSFGNDAENGPLVVSIAAGVTLHTLQALLPEGSPVVRVMPNVAAVVGAAASAYCLGENATEDDAAWVETLLGAVGEVVQVQESELDAVTGLSGSGPAYAFSIIDALADGAVMEGLPRDVALRLAAQTLVGAGKMALETGKHPSLLKDEVTSPGGTTARGLHALAQGGLRGTLMNAVKAATDRSRELGKKS